jgi:hypothetical protein
MTAAAPTAVCRRLHRDVHAPSFDLSQCCCPRCSFCRLLQRLHAAVTGQFARHSALLPPHFYLLNGIELVSTGRLHGRSRWWGARHVVGVVSQHCLALPAPSDGSARA